MVDQPIVDVGASGNTVYAVVRYADVRMLSLTPDGELRESGRMDAFDDVGLAPWHVAASERGLAVAFNPVHGGNPRIAYYDADASPLAFTSQVQLTGEGPIGDLLLAGSDLTVLGNGIIRVAVRSDGSMQAGEEQPLLGWVVDMARTREALLLRDGWSTVWCVANDGTHPGNWADLKRLDGLSRAYDIASSGEFLFAVDGADGLRVFQFVGPCEATEVGTYSSNPEFIDAVQVDGDVLVAMASNHVRGAGSQSLRVVDVSIPGTPRQVRQVDIDVEHDGWLSFTAFDLAQGIVAVAGRSGGIFFLDTTTTTVRGMSEALERQETVVDLQWDTDGHLYFTTSSSLQVADAGNLAAPLIVDKRTLFPPVGAVGCAGPTVLAAATWPTGESSVLQVFDADTGLREFDVVDTLNGGQPPLAIVSDERDVFVVDRDVGLLLLQPSGAARRQIFIPTRYAGAY